GYGGALAAGAVAEAVDRGHALVVMPGGPGDDRWTGVPVDGLIVVAPVMGDPAVTEARRRGLAVVTDGRPPAPEHSRVPYAHSDMEQGVRLVMEHLAERGARRVGLLTGPSSDAYTRDSEHAYVRWCAGRAWPATVERAGGGEPPLDAARRLLASERRPDAVHALHESYGEAVLTAAAERGLAVPGDLLVTAMGDGAPHPELTLLSRSPRATGALCVTLLIDVLHGGRPEPRPVPCALLPGASTAVGGERGHARPVPAPRTA
ncbi:LacI family transcriptional regulator, partial [Streptomyces clavuligerus]